MTVSKLADRFIRSAPGSYRAGGNGKVTRVVLHRMEAPLRAGTAVSVANYFAGGAGGRGVSCHFCVDPSTTVACLQEEDLGYHAPPNGGSIGIEQAGYCTNDDWGSDLGQQMLARTLALTADLCARYSLPKVWLSAADLRAGRSGVTSHHQVSLAYGQSSHEDPDPHFPQGVFMARLSGSTPNPQEDDMFDDNASKRLDIAISKIVDVQKSEDDLRGRQVDIQKKLDAQAARLDSIEATLAKTAH